MVIEVIAQSVADAIAAEAGGADRLELVRDLDQDGLTPPPELVRAVCEAVRLPVFAMIRPRNSFTIGPEDHELLAVEARSATMAGARGLVTGYVNASGGVDSAALAVVRGAAGPGAGLTFHRAFDRLADPRAALPLLAAHGIRRILTSGGAPTAWEGRARIRDLVSPAGAHHIKVMAGGGLTPENVVALIRETGVTEVHFGAGVHESQDPMASVSRARVMAALQTIREAEGSVKASKNRAYALLERLEAALEAGEIDEATWYEKIAAVITPAYLAGEDPRAQSGSSGDEAHWQAARELIVDAMDRDGTFLDVGCASGYLMESVQRWARERGRTVEPYGLDIAPELADLARRRLPHWADRVFVGNAIDWQPPARFDFVRTGLEYVPARRQRDLIEHLLGAVVTPGGRLIIGVHKEEKVELQTEPTLEEQVAGWGFGIAGRSERPHDTDARFVNRLFWIDTPGT